MLNGKIEQHIAHSPHPSQGLLNRVKNVIDARQHQGHVNHVTGDIHYITLGLKGSKTILTIHDVGFMKRGSWLKRQILRLFWLTWPVRKVALVTTISKESKKDILRYVRCPEDKIKIIPNFVSKRFQYTPKPFNSQQPTILHIGTKYNKNLPRLIEALKDIPCTLDIVGTLTDEQLQLLKKYQIKYKNSANISNQEMVDKYINCDLLAFVSLLEGFGLPIVEANATGRPVITSNISSMPEIAGEAAHLVNPFEVESIRSGILKLIEDKAYREQLIKKGLGNVERFKLEKIASEYLKVYQFIAEKNNH